MLKVKDYGNIFPVLCRCDVAKILRRLTTVVMQMAFCPCFEFYRVGHISRDRDNSIVLEPDTSETNEYQCPPERHCDVIPQRWRGAFSEDMILSWV